MRFYEKFLEETVVKQSRGLAEELVIEELPVENATTHLRLGEATLQDVAATYRFCSEKELEADQKEVWW